MGKGRLPTYCRALLLLLPTWFRFQLESFSATDPAPGGDKTGGYSRGALGAAYVPANPVVANLTDALIWQQVGGMWQQAPNQTDCNVLAIQQSIMMVRGWACLPIR